MKKLFFWLFAIVAVLIAVAFVVPQFIPVSTYKDTIEEQASNALGRKITIGDDLSIKIFPRTAFRVTELQIDNPDGFASPYFIRVEEADIGVELFKLLKKEVQINRFILTGADINLEKKKSGSVNWEIGKTEAAQTSGDSGADTAAQLSDIRLGDVRIVNGRATYKDLVSGQTFEMDDIDVDVTLNSLETPLEARGRMNFQGAATKIDIVMTTLGKYLRGEETNLKFALDLGDSSAGGDLKLGFGGKNISLNGPVNFNAPDLPALAALAGSPLPEAPGFDSFSVSGQLSGNSDVIKLGGAVIKFDAIDATGDLQLALSGARPKATGTLNTPALDLRPYMPPPATSSEGFPAWSKEKMDFTSLRNIDADLDISASNIYLNQMTFGQSEMDLTISNGRMTAEIPKMEMYEGNGSGRMVVNARSATPSFAGNFTMNKVDAEPFCVDVLSMDNLLGLGGFKFNFTASGASQAAIMNTIDGDGGFDVDDGAVKGFNIAKLARAAASFQSGINPTAVTSAISSARGPTEATDFSSFLSNFQMQNGVMTIPTISMDSPVLTMIGSGTVNLPQQTIDIRLQPRASLNVDGSGGRGIAVPVRITGTFSQPKVNVDIQQLLKGEAGKRLRGVVDDALGDRIKDSPAGGLLDGVLDRATGGARNETQTNTADAASGDEEADPIEEAAKSAIGSIFGRRSKDDDKDEDPDQ